MRNYVILQPIGELEPGEYEAERRRITALEISKSFSVDGTSIREDILSLLLSSCSMLTCPTLTCHIIEHLSMGEVESFVKHRYTWHQMLELELELELELH
jgi:hypothetical protein